MKAMVTVGCFMEKLVIIERWKVTIIHANNKRNVHFTGAIPGFLKENLQLTIYKRKK